jgi:quercetin dioxygenase-like cupin family protein
MSRKRILTLAAALTATVFIVAGVVPSAAQVTPPPIATELLTARAVFTDDVRLKFKLFEEDGGVDVVNVPDPSRTLVARFTVQPGAQFPWHTHAGPVIVNIVSGTLVYVPAEGCDHRSYPAGTAFVDPGRGHVHSAFNPGPGETVFVATFFDAPATDPLLIPADAPSDCVL